MRYLPACFVEGMVENMTPVLAVVILASAMPNDASLMPSIASSSAGMKHWVPHKASRPRDKFLNFECKEQIIRQAYKLKQVVSPRASVTEHFTAWVLCQRRNFRQCG